MCICTILSSPASQMSTYRRTMYNLESLPPPAYAACPHIPGIPLGERFIETDMCPAKYPGRLSGGCWSTDRQNRAD